MTTATGEAGPAPAAEDWAASQSYELLYWRDHWPLRAEPIEAIRRQRFDVAQWFLDALGFPREGESRRFHGFQGRVLEVGCGPIGFFDLVEGIACDAMDSLMADYARELPYATLGPAGSTTYLAETRLEALTGAYDFVVCSNVLDHTGDWRAFLRLLCATAQRAAGGRLLLYTHTRGAPLPGHTQVFSPGEVLDAVQAEGLRQVERVVARPCPPHAEYELFLRAMAG